MSRTGTHRALPLAAAVLLLLMGCNGDVSDPAPDTADDGDLRAEVVEKIHDPDEVWYSGGFAHQGTWDLRVCLLDPEGQPRDGHCATMPVSEGTWKVHEVGDEIEAPAGLRWQ